MLAAEFMDIERPTPEHELLIAICERAILDLKTKSADVDIVDYVTASQFVFGGAMKSILEENFEIDSEVIERLIKEIKHESSRAQDSKLDDVFVDEVWERFPNKKHSGGRAAIKQQLLHICGYDENLIRQYRASYKRQRAINGHKGAA